MVIVLALQSVAAMALTGVAGAALNLAKKNPRSLGDSASQFVAWFFRICRSTVANCLAPRPYHGDYVRAARFGAWKKLKLGGQHPLLPIASIGQLGTAAPDPNKKTALGDTLTSAEAVT